MKHGSLWPTINTISNNNRGKLMDIISSQQKNKAQDSNTVSAAKSATKKKFLKVTSFRAMLVITIVAVLFGIWSMIGFNMESLYVKSDKIQAVDVSIGGSNNGDQIYFGKIKKITSKYIVLDDVFYIPSSANGSNIQLEPLVCQIDKPINRMMINRSSVNWYENLQSDGQVAQAITNYEKSNPKTPSCPAPTPAKK